MSDLEIGRLGGSSPAALREPLRQAAHEFEGVFVAKLFREMRATIPADEEPDQGEELFLAMLDDTLAREAAGRSTRGLGEASYRQLVARLEGATQDRDGTVTSGRE